MPFLSEIGIFAILLKLLGEQRADSALRRFFV